MDDFYENDYEQDDFETYNANEADDYRNEGSDWDDERLEFADPGGNSALRAASSRNPRNLPCPTCDSPNRLTPADVRRGYQCDRCADAAEGGYGY